MSNVSSLKKIFWIAAVLDTIRQRIIAIAQSHCTKQDDILLNIAMKIPINRPYYSVRVLHMHGL